LLLATVYRLLALFLTGERRACYTVHASGKLQERVDLAAPGAARLSSDGAGGPESLSQ